MEVWGGTRNLVCSSFLVLILIYVSVLLIRLVGAKPTWSGRADMLSPAGNIGLICLTGEMLRTRDPL